MGTGLRTPVVERKRERRRGLEKQTATLENAVIITAMARSPRQLMVKRRVVQFGVCHETEEGAVAGDCENGSRLLAEEGGDENVFVTGEGHWLPSLDGIHAENAGGVVRTRSDDERAAAVPLYADHVVARPSKDAMQLERRKLAL